MGHAVHSMVIRFAVALQEEGAAPPLVIVVAMTPTAERDAKVGLARVVDQVQREDLLPHYRCRALQLQRLLRLAEQ